VFGASRSDPGGLGGVEVTSITSRCICWRSLPGSHIDGVYPCGAGADAGRAETECGPGRLRDDPARATQRDLAPPPGTRVCPSHNPAIVIAAAVVTSRPVGLDINHLDFRKALRPGAVMMTSLRLPLVSVSGVRSASPGAFHGLAAVGVAGELVEDSAPIRLAFCLATELGGQSGVVTQGFGDGPARPGASVSQSTSTASAAASRASSFSPTRHNAAEWKDNARANAGPWRPGSSSSSPR
jgi:hypothetical protein